MRAIIKKIYGLIPFKKQIFILLKKFWSPRPSIYQHLHFKGVIKVPLKDGNDFKIRHYGYQVENDIFWSGLAGKWEKFSIETWTTLSKNSEVIFDVGANTGIYSLVAKTVNKNARVYAFEPVRRVYEKLLFNNKINNYDINCINKAASNQTGYAELFDTNEEHEYSASLNNNSGLINAQNVTKIETVTLDNFIKANGIKHPDLIKIDVETFEPEVLEGFSETLRVSRPTLIIEILTDDIGKRVTELTGGLGYLYFNIDEASGLKKVERLTRGTHMNFLICTEKVAQGLQIV